VASYHVTPAHRNGLLIRPSGH